MTQIICRMYSTKDAASAAAEDLRQVGFQTVHLFVRDDNADPDSDAAAPAKDVVIEELVTEMTEAYVVRSHAQLYASEIAEGAGLVIVRAFFGTGKAAHAILERRDPVESPVAEHRARSVAWSEAHPFSSAFQWPTIAKHRLPFAHVMNVRSVTRKPCTFSSCLGMSLLSDSRTPFSSGMGMPTLSKKRRFLS